MNRTSRIAFLTEILPLYKKNENPFLTTNCGLWGKRVEHKRPTKVQELLQSNKKGYRRLRATRKERRGDRLQIA
jgi:hypothetical protein